MPRKSTQVSKSKSEANEADWYTTPEGRRQTQGEFARALRAGTLSRSAGLRVARTDPTLLRQLMERAKLEGAIRELKEARISIAVAIADLERAMQIAEKTGVGYQTVLKQAIHAGLRKAG
jgi:hypothetical protein